MRSDADNRFRGGNKIFRGGNARWVGSAPFRHGVARSEGALVRASRADGGGSAIDTRDIDA